jgi:hypothetical protein
MPSQATALNVDQSGTTGEGMKLVTRVVLRVPPPAEFDRMCAMLSTLGIEQLKTYFPGLWHDVEQEIWSAGWR